MADYIFTVSGNISTLSQKSVLRQHNPHLANTYILIKNGKFYTKKNPIFNYSWYDKLNFSLLGKIAKLMSVYFGIPIEWDNIVGREPPVGDSRLDRL